MSENRQDDRMQTSGFTIFFRKDTVDEEVIAHSFDRDIFFQSIPDFNSASASLIIDVGAHIGTFSMTASKLDSAIKILAIEASSDNYKLLRKNIKINNLEDSILPQHYALSDRIGTEILYKGKENWGYTITKRDSKNTENVRSTTLEELFRENQIDHCDLIKFNCEGAEFKAILSTPYEVINKVGMMLILIHEDLENRFNRSDIYRYLNKNGFFYRSLNFKENRGWVIAKNLRFYSKFSDLIFRVGKAFKRF